MNHSPGRFNVGDRVRVLSDNPAGNPRTPVYIRGQTGVVAALQGITINPLDHRDLYPPLYSVVFEVAQLYGTPSRDRLSVDLHEDWLEPA